MQESQANLAACQAAQAGIPAGYCYVDGKIQNPPAAVTDALSKCPANQQQLLRFVTGSNMVPTPAQGAVAFIACLGANVETAP